MRWYLALTMVVAGCGTPGAMGDLGGGDAACGDGCPPSACDDGVKNGGETDVDCGAACPKRCGLRPISKWHA